jgi:hypothetical protein
MGETQFAVLPSTVMQVKQREWRKLHNEELHDLYSSPSITRMVKARKMRWAGHIARMGEKVGGKARGKEAARKTKAKVGG